MAGSSSAYLINPISSSADETKGIPASFSGDHSDGSAFGTIEHIQGDGTYAGSRVQFELFNIGHSGGPDEPDLARVNSGSNIDRGINTTLGWDVVAELITINSLKYFLVKMRGRVKCTFRNH